MKKTIIIILIIVTLGAASVIGYIRMDQGRIRSYYKNQDHYVLSTGEIEYLTYQDGEDVLYVGMKNLSYGFDENCFQIEGDSLTISLENGICDKILPGVTVEFISAPEHFGNGDKMPIVSLIVDGEVLLEFEDGYNSLLRDADDGIVRSNSVILIALGVMLIILAILTVKISVTMITKSNQKDQEFAAITAQKETNE